MPDWQLLREWGESLRSGGAARTLRAHAEALAAARSERRSLFTALVIAAISIFWDPAVRRVPSAATARPC